MIAYQMKCENGHQFEGWFKSNADFDKLQGAGLIECTNCTSTNVTKALMAPRLTSKSNTKDLTNTETSQTLSQMRKALKDAKNVGWQFAKEARAIHYGDKAPAQIYGKSEPEDVKALLDEGISILPLPFDPDVKEN